MKLIKPNASPTTLAGFSRASTATYLDDNGALQTAGVNVARWQDGRLLVEAQATNCALGTDSDALTTWSNYVTGAGAVTRQVVADPQFGNVLRLTKTSGAEGDRAGVAGFSRLAGMSGTSYVFSCWVRRSADALGQVYADADRLTGGLITAATLLSGAPAGQWTRLSAVGSNALGLAGGGTPYVWLDGPVGSTVDIKLPNVTLGTVLSSAFPAGAAPATRAADVFTGGGLLHTSATDATAAYVAGTTYAAGALVAFERSRYQSLQASNTGRQPDTNPTWWARLGPTNQWAMFDDQVSTQTTATNELRVAVATGGMDSLAVMGVDASRVQITVTDGAGGPVLYTQAQGLEAEEVLSWADYFFNDPSFRRTQALFTGIPVLAGAVACMVFGVASPVAIGHVVFGRMKSLGGVRYGVRAGIKDFSRKETDEFGVTTFVRRAFSKTLTASVWVDKFAVNRVQNLLETLRATPVLWVGSDDAAWSQPLLVFGFYRDFYGAIDYPMNAIYSLEIEGLI